MPDDTVRFSLKTAVGPAIVETAEIDEALDVPYRGRIRLHLEDPNATAESLLGQDAVLTWERDAYARKLCGLVRRVQEYSRGEDGTAFEIDLVPALSLLDLSRNTRMFQEKKVPDILEAVLKEKLGPYSRDV